MNGKTTADKALIALQYVEELSLKKKRELLEQLPDPSVWSAERNADLLKRILGDKQKNGFLTNLSRISDLFDKMTAADVDYVTCFDEEYPNRLREIYDYPLVLFMKGNSALLNTDCIAVVGTRTPTRYGAKVCDSFTREFSRAGLTVVSGFARGVDGTAHRACADSESPTIAVFACGVDVCYPAEHKGLMEAILSRNGLVVTEYPLGTPPMQYHFPERNRIISGLSCGVFIPEATVKSGSLITARLAVEQGKELFVVPGNINSPESEGTNKLLQEMPHSLVIEPQDVFDRLNIRISAKQDEIIELTLAETLITEALHDKELHFEELLDAAGLSAGELNNLLINLELNGIIEQTSGNYYCLS